MPLLGLVGRVCMGSMGQDAFQSIEESHFLSSSIVRSCRIVLGLVDLIALHRQNPTGQPPVVCWRVGLELLARSGAWFRSAGLTTSEGRVW